jgi:hypothetical protein
VAVTAAIGDQAPSWRHGPEEDAGTLVVTRLAFGKKQGFAFSLADRMQLGIQAALRSADAAGKAPF